MTSDDASERPEGLRGYVRFSAKLARAICERIAAGETQLSICADPGMPSRNTLRRWARERSDFAKIFERAKAFGNRTGMGRPSTYCLATAHEIAVRVSEGETLTAISKDPAMPSMGTIFYWRKSNAEFAEALKQAREVLAERLCDLGWEMAQDATPKTAHLVRVQLGQLRWTAGILSPRTHGRLKATEPPEPRRSRPSWSATSSSRGTPRRASSGWWATVPTRRPCSPSATAKGSGPTRPRSSASSTPTTSPPAAPRRWRGQPTRMTPKAGAEVCFRFAAIASPNPTGAGRP